MRNTFYSRHRDWGTHEILLDTVWYGKYILPETEDGANPLLNNKSIISIPVFCILQQALSLDPSHMVWHLQYYNSSVLNRTCKSLHGVWRL